MGLRQYKGGVGGGPCIGLCKQKPLSVTFSYALFPYFQDFFLTPDAFGPCDDLSLQNLVPFQSSICLDVGNQQTY